MLYHRYILKQIASGEQQYINEDTYENYANRWTPTERRMVYSYIKNPKESFVEEIEPYKKPDIVRKIRTANKSVPSNKSTEKVEDVIFTKQDLMDSIEKDDTIQNSSKQQWIIVLNNLTKIFGLENRPFSNMLNIDDEKIVDTISKKYTNKKH